MRKLLTSFFIVIFTVCYSQNKQPKIGLILSGGGAKGFAHVGVLKEIDKAGLQLDYIGGTSMGAIAAALYAAGYSGAQIEKIVLDTDFVNVLRDKLPRNATTFFEKDHGEKTVLSLPVKKGAVSFPKGVSKGQNVLNLLYELFSSAEGLTDFSKLPIPFFCVATDVETGGPVILEQGNLPIALRASSSFPTLLTPVNLNDKLLIDGGVANNFPVSILKSKGIDIVIGVDVEGRLYEKEKLNSVVAIMNQVLSYQMYKKSNQEKKGANIYIHPKVYKFGVVDFDKKEEILQKGIEEGAKYAKVFKELAAKQTIKKTRKKLHFDTKKYLISEINLSGSNYYTKSFVLGKLNIKEGDSLTRQEITKRIYLLSATKNYDNIAYNLVPKNKTYALNFTVKESKEYASLNLGVHYDLLYRSGVLANYSQKHLLLNNDLFSLDAVLGDNLRYNLNYFVDNGFFTSFGVNSRFNHFTTNAKFNPILLDFPTISKINLKYRDFTNQVFIQTAFNRKFTLGVGVEHKNLKITTGTIRTAGASETIFDDSNYLNSYGYLKLDTFDEKYFVTNGYFADVMFKWYMTSSDALDNFKPFLQGQGTLAFAKTFWNKFTFKMTNQAGFTFNKITSNVFDFYLGGYNQNYINTFVPFYGYDFAELSDRTFIKSEFNFRYAIAKNHHASFIANYGRLEGNVFRDIDLFKDIKTGYAIGYSYNTFIGPIELKYSFSPDTNSKILLFNLGFWF